VARIDRYCAALAVDLSVDEHAEVLHVQQVANLQAPFPRHVAGLS
jgi:hypothetical protein